MGYRSSHQELRRKAARVFNACIAPFVEATLIHTLPFTDTLSEYDSSIPVDEFLGRLAVVSSIVMC